MKKIFLTLAIFVMALCANAQTNQYFWYQGNLMMGNPIAQIDSVTFGEGEPADTLHIFLPRTIIKAVHDTVYITIHDTVCPDAIPEGALAGEFSVSATKKVRFSKGNLQYQASTDTWRFAENQYDYIGEGNSNISPTYSGWIDLFGWGTSGYNNKYPYMTSNNSIDYGNGASDITETNYDWGVYNKISNGGNAKGLWHTLSIDEWMFLYGTRVGADTLRSRATVNNKHGFIFLPDKWIIPAGISFTPDADNWITNHYSQEEWLKMENAGAIFLPAAGLRSETNVSSVESLGFYWSTSFVDDAYTASYVEFLFDWMNALGYNNRYYGLSVRLVQDVE